MKEINKKIPKKSAKKTFVILDAHALIHRAYHALPAFSNSAGEPTGALYGVTTMTLKIIETFNPDYIVAAFDLPKPTFRHESYGAYKAGRIKAEDDLVVQLESARKLFEAFGIKVLDAEGFEADDVIGTLVEQYKKTPGLTIIIASGDMDTMQLIEDDKIKVFTLKKGLNDTILYDEDAVRSRFGFGPLQLVDYKGLRGDTSDNIIGVPGIGEKTATTILQAFGSLEKLYEAIEKDRDSVLKAGISERMVKLLEEHKEDAFFSKTLATIRRDAPVKYSFPEQNYKDLVDTKELLELFAHYEFRSLAHRVKKIFSLEDEPQAQQESIDPMFLYKTAVALWVLYSENTIADYETILQKTKTNTLDEAYKTIVEELKKRNLIDVFTKIEEPLIPIVSAMEETGILIDREHFVKIRTQIEARLREIEKQVTELVGVTINLNSPKQLSGLLFDTLGLKTKGKRKESGAFTTNAETLELLREAHPIIPLILEQRELQKILSSYVESLLTHIAEDGRIHAKFFQHGTTTGRFSSADPNLQTIPAGGKWGKEVRHGFVAKEGSVFIACDYSQIELRVLAMLSRDEKLLESFQQGKDIHASVASLVFGVPENAVTAEMRRNAKVINFGIIYGMGVQALQKNLGTTKEKTQQFYDEYFSAFPTIKAYLDSSKDYAREHGYTETAFGRRRYFPTINSKIPFLRSFAERTASNAPLQGTAADIIKLAIVDVDRALNKSGIQNKAKLVLQVHDELVYEVQKEVVEEAKEIIISAMVGAIDHSPIKLDVPGVPLAVSVALGARLDDLK
jgi:DNA polymerase-1